MRQLATIPKAVMPWLYEDDTTNFPGESTAPPSSVS